MMTSSQQNTMPNLTYCLVAHREPEAISDLNPPLRTVAPSGRCNSVYHKSRNASVIRCLPFPVSAKYTTDLNVHHVA